MNILVIGASGMIGSTMFRVLHEKFPSAVYGTIRNPDIKKYFPTDQAKNLIADVDVENADTMVRLLTTTHPDIVINCAGLTKHKPGAEDPIISIPINTLMPHRISRLCAMIGARFVHVSTDCVFSGRHGNYKESDFADASDVYGRSKLLGEVSYRNSVTLRTSTIGKELDSSYGLLGWFLAQSGRCNGYKNAIFSGLPTVLFAQIVRDIVIPDKNLTGLFHVSASPISKYDLLHKIAKVYRKEIDIIPDEAFCIDRSLDSTRFEKATGYAAPGWDEMINLMHSYE